MHTHEDFSLISQVAVNSIVNIPIQSSSNSTTKFKFPITPPPPNKIQDERSPITIFQDMLGILSDTPKLSYKYYIDLLLNRDGGLPEIDSNGVELSASLIRQAIKDFEPTLTHMKYIEYWKDRSKPTCKAVLARIKSNSTRPSYVCESPDTGQ